MNRPKSARGAFLDVRVQPGARENRVIGRIEGRLKIKINAPALEGEANAALLGFLSEKFGVPKTRLKIVRGERSRAKRVLIEGMTPADAEREVVKILKEAECGTDVDEKGI